MSSDIERLRRAYACVPVLAELARNPAGVYIHFLRKKLKISDAEARGSLVLLSSMGLVVRERAYHIDDSPITDVYTAMGYVQWPVHVWKITDQGRKMLPRLDS